VFSAPKQSAGDIYNRVADMRLSAHDASFLYTETASGPMHMIGLTVLDGAATFEEIFAYYAARVHRVPRLRQRLAFVPFNVAHPKWIDDPDFDLGNHLVRHPVPPNTSVQRAIEIALELGEALLDRNRPLWLTYVLEDLDGKTLLAQMSHHAFVDGATAVAMTTVLTDPSPDAPDPEPESSPWRPLPMPSPTELWQEAVAENAQQTFAQARRLVSEAPKMAELAQKAAPLMQRMARPVMVAPWNASLIGPKRTIATLEYSLDDFRPIRKSLGGTVNDIVVSVVMEGAARYLQAKGEVLEDQYLRLMCPVDVRDADDDPLDMSGNRVSAMFPVLAAGPMDMLERYQTVRDELSEIKRNDEPRVMDQLQHLQPNNPPIAQSQTLSVGTEWDPTVAAARAPLPILPHTGGPRPQQLGFNFTCTNVPGANWTQYVAGHQVLTAIGTLMLGGNLGFGAGVASFDGRVTFVFTADPRLMPDVDHFAAHVREAFSELSDRAQVNPDN